MGYGISYDRRSNASVLVGKKILGIFWSEDYLVFETDHGKVAYTVDGDCCSHSYFHDFLGVRKLITGGPVISMQEVEMGEVDVLPGDKYADDSIAAYGFEIVVEDPRFGEVTAVLSFRNSSNGYYGGWMEPVSDPEQVTGLTQLFDDYLGD